MRVLQAVAQATAAALSGIAASQTLGAAGNLVLSGTLVSKWYAGSGPVAYTANEPSLQASGDFQSGLIVTGSTAAILNPPKTVALTSTTATTNAGVTFTVSGFDRVGMAITETITGPAGSATVVGKKLFAVVTQISASAAVTSVEAGIDGSSYSRWINLGNQRGHYTYKQVVLATGITSGVNLQTTSTPMNELGGHSNGQANWSATDDDTFVWGGGDLPEDIEVTALTLVASGNGIYTDQLSTDNASPFAFVRIQVAAGTNSKVILRVIPTRTA